MMISLFNLLSGTVRIYPTLVYIIKIDFFLLRRRKLEYFYYHFTYLSCDYSRHLYTRIIVNISSFIFDDLKRITS